jgi:Fuc2NAc and GlcNAc transferase
MNLWISIVVAFFAGVLCTGWLRHYAMQQSLLDIPNERSSHTRPTPRGGGLSITVIVLVTILLLGMYDYFPSVILSALLPAALVIGLIGWLDDHFQLSVLWRATAYLLAACWFSWLSGGLPRLSLGTGIWETGIWNIPIVVLGLAWLTNLYNFMDGADALAGLQALLAGTAGAVLFWLQGAESLSLLASVTATATAGFLFWNWPPARIFMGDVGSCFLGFLFGCMAVLGEVLGGLPALLWLILLGTFVWDATCTLIMRMLRGETWYAAHRSHAYQRLLQLGWSHGRLALGFIIYNVLILWPLTLWAWHYPGDLLPVVGLSAIVTVLVWGIIQMLFFRHRRIGT